MTNFRVLDILSIYSNISEIRILIKIKFCRDVSIQTDASKNNRFSTKEATNYIPPSEKKKKVPVCAKLTIKTLKFRSSVFIVSWLWTSFTPGFTFSVLTWASDCQLASVVFTLIRTEAVNQKCFSRKVFFQYLAHLKEIIRAKMWLQLYWIQTSTWVLFRKYATYLQQNAFFRERIWGTGSVYRSKYRGYKCRRSP